VKGWRSQDLNAMHKEIYGILYLKKRQLDMTGVPSLPRTGLRDIYIAYPFRKCLQNIFSSMDLTNLQTPHGH
jgi:hypothetical protein